MAKQHFLIHAGTPLVGGGLAAPPERWIQAFPQGQWSNWKTLLSQLGSDDTVWVPTAIPDWEAKVRTLLVHASAPAIAVVTAVPDDVEGLTALNAGARAYCHQLAIPAVLREVQQVLDHGGLWIGPDLVQRLAVASRSALVSRPPESLPKADLSVLSERERQVAQAVAAGHSNKEVAARLFISERTVKAHLGAIFEKLGVRDRLQLVLRVTGSAPQV